VDAAGEPLGPAIMYNDGRAQAEADDVQTVGAALADKLGYRFVASFALPRLLWLRRHRPGLWAAARYFLSPTDFILGRLTGDYMVTDYSNALKTGYDLVDGCWPDFVAELLGLRPTRFPRVVAPGSPAGQVIPSAAGQTGLVAGTPVLAGMTDGCASQVSTRAVTPGQWCSTLGTTLVLKGVTRDLVRDPQGRVYCHRHPDGFWLPGGASNTGGEAITRRFPAERLPQLNAAALGCAPTDLLVYPLARTGERFPFNRPRAEAFVIGETDDEATLYTAYLEGEAYVERLAYDVLEELGAEVGPTIYVAGGATASSAWLQLRADILGRSLIVPEDGGAAKGAAVVAAGGVHYGGLVPAAEAMVRLAGEVRPRPEFRAAYEGRYARFCEACRQRDYIC
jgi:D-ribulokinase